MHEGHRKRMRERFLKDGDFQNFAPHEVLELLLYSTIARGDTNPIGHALIDKFGTLANVFEASPEELKEVSGIGESSAFLLSLIPHLCQAFGLTRSLLAALLKKSHMHSRLHIRSICKEQ